MERIEPSECDVSPHNPFELASLTSGWQNYFRETSCIPLLAPLLLFPRANALTPTSLSAFAFQSWSEQKTINAGLVISLVRMLVGGAGSGKMANQKALLVSGVSRCLIELGLASNAPVVVKSQVGRPFR